MTRWPVRPASALTPAVLGLLLWASAVPAQELLEAGPYDPDVPTVAELRGFPTGAGFSTYREIERVVGGVAAASERVRLETYGSSVEGRPLRLVWVSSPANLARLDELRAANRGLMEAPDSVNLAEWPIFVWLSFGVHGDEASATEAALELLYHLAASRDPAVTAWLDHAVVTIDPLLNPDGHERYVAWYRGVLGEAPDPDPEAREHRPPWPGGRTNHWYADLNRDWAWGVQPETRARREVYLATLPQVHVDFHEMDPESSYFFFPAASPVHAFYPSSTAHWGRVFGQANASAFDARGWPYYTEEDFDLFYPGYGDSWPSFYGATGMTYEQAGGGTAGVVLARRDGSLLTLSDRIEHHLVAALTTIATAVDRRAERLADFVEFWRPEERTAPQAPAAYLIPRGGPEADSLAALLVRQGLRVDTLAAAFSGGGLVPYPGSPPRTTLPPGTFLLTGDQPLGRYLAALMAPGDVLPDTTLFYDLTGWTLPYLYDVPAYQAATLPTVAAHPWRPAPAAEATQPPAGTVALVWSYESLADVVAAARLAGRGWRVQVATRPFRAAGRAWRAGAFVVVVGRQPDSLAGGPAGAASGRVAAALAEAGAWPVALRSFRTEEGIDLGSDRFRTLRTPRVAIAAGPVTDPVSVGAAWHFLSMAGVPLDIVDLDDLAARPEPYTAIVLPDGPDAEAYAEALGDDETERLGGWVEQGGTLVGIRAGAAWLTEEKSGITEVELAAEPEPTDEDRLRPEAVRELDQVRRRIPGTLLLAAVDTTSALGFGFPDGEAAVLARDPTELAPAEVGNAWMYADRDPLAGYLPTAARERLSGTPYAVVVAKGRGSVVLFADDPAFRGILPALEKLYLNAILIVPGS